MALTVLQLFEFQRDDLSWVAQGLDHDVAFEAPTLDRLRQAVAMFFAQHVNHAQIAGTALFVELGPAPDSYREMYTGTGHV